MAVCLIFSVVYIQAQAVIRGQVVDAESREPLIGAVVQWPSGMDGTTTDERGFFTIKKKEGQRALEIKYLGYDALTVDWLPGEEDLGVIGLQRTSTTLNEVVVSGSAANYKGEFKGSNFRISPQRLERLNPLSTEEALRTVPGVNIIGDMGLSNRPNISIRGSWGRRSKKVLLLEDGSPAAPAPYIAPGAYYNPVSDRLTAIEVYKGADMLRYGPNNMYGAVNYITALPPQKPQLRLKLIGGQRSYQTGLLSYGGTWNNLGALVEGVYKSFDGFTDNSSVDLLNLNAKVFAKLSEKQSFYFKVSGQFEDNQASLSSQTPFTFDMDPTQNPFDADQFTMRRYGVDIIHKWLPMPGLSFQTKVYASDFERDWWRQITTKVKASELRSYVGEDIFHERYSYLEGQSFTDEDYVIAGRIVNGRESTADSRWAYTVAGFKETMDYDWYAFGQAHKLEASINFHRETFKDRIVVADSSRWARTGRTTTDLWYRLWSFNAFVRNEFRWRDWAVTPIVRFEHVDMYRQDLLAAAQDPDITGTDDGREPNAYNQLLPGVTLEYESTLGSFYGSVYQGMIAPSKVFGFLVERDGIVTNPLAGQSINIDPELSWNREIGWRGSMMDGHLSGQIAYFNNTSRNFYAGGRNEVFQQLGKINVQGLELATVAELLKASDHRLSLTANVNFMRSRVLEGALVDNDLFSQVIHSEKTRQEYIEKVNSNRSAYEVYVTDGAGDEVLYDDAVLDASMFGSISKSVLKFGDDGLDDAEAPYTPAWNTTVQLNYDYKRFSVGALGHFVSKQYTEFHNFVSESADGAIGEIPAFYSLDAYANLDFLLREKLECTVFLNAKNITNEIYRASRLNRATSGVFGGGFRQIIFGLNVKI